MSKQVSIFIFLLFSVSYAFGQCEQINDAATKTDETLAQIKTELGLPPDPKGRYDGRYDDVHFFIIDLTDPTNFFYSRGRNVEGACIEFREGHVYHYSLSDLEASRSNLAVLRSGKLVNFSSTNCLDSKDSLEGLLAILETDPSGAIRSKEEMNRIHNYRRFSFFTTTDGYRARCNSDKRIPANIDEQYDRPAILFRMGEFLMGILSPKQRDTVTWYLQEEGRGVGFFVWDLTEPSNKQTSLLERIEFKEGHVYHFGFIDTALSYSNIAVLTRGTVKFFRTINCSEKGDDISEVERFLEKELKLGEKKDLGTLSRLKEYRNYGMYINRAIASSPDCQELNS